MIGGLLILGVVLSLDNFRTSIALGGLRLRGREAVRVAAAFGLWDALAPLAGILAGRYAARSIGSTGDLVASIALAAYGLYLVVEGCRRAAPEEPRRRWGLFALPLPLSVDNVVAGTSVALLGRSPWLAPALFGATTAAMSLVGLRVGRAAASFVRLRPDLVTGVALMVMSVVLGLGLSPTGWDG